MFMGLAQNLGNGWCDHQDLADGRRRGGPVLRPLVDGPAVDCSNVIAFLQGSPNVCLGKNFKDASPMLGSGFE